MAKVKVDLGVAEVIGKVKDTETINQADKTTALLIRAVHAALSPLEKWVLQKESNIEQTRKLLEKKLKNVPVENIITPPMYIMYILHMWKLSSKCHHMMHLFFRI